MEKVFYILRKGDAYLAQVQMYCNFALVFLTYDDADEHRETMREEGIKIIRVTITEVEVTNVDEEPLSQVSEEEAR